MDSLCLLSFLLTGEPSLAEKCFVRGLEDSRKGNPVFNEWAVSWARRTIISESNPYDLVTATAQLHVKLYVRWWREPCHDAASEDCQYCWPPAIRALRVRDVRARALLFSGVLASFEHPPGRCDRRARLGTTTDRKGGGASRQSGKHRFGRASAPRPPWTSTPA